MNDRQQTLKWLKWLSELSNNMSVMFITATDNSSLCLNSHNFSSLLFFSMTLLSTQYFYKMLNVYFTLWLMNVKWGNYKLWLHFHQPLYFDQISCTFIKLLQHFVTPFHLTQPFLLLLFSVHNEWMNF